MQRATQRYIEFLLNPRLTDCPLSFKVQPMPNLTHKHRKITKGKIGLGLFLSLATLVFIALGIWQVERLSWKEALIARVDARIHATPIPAPAASDWQNITAENYEYTHVTVTGTFEKSKETLVFASTDYGPGYWVLTPLKSDTIGTVLINRGFIPLDKKDPATRPESQAAGEQTVTGLLRISEPKGTLLRSNQPTENRWYSRDVQAIATNKGLNAVAPYFIDADAAPNSKALPIGGLTQVSFPNNHLQYALTWFGMAIMSLVFLVYLFRPKPAKI